jgi:hypothetical protein
MAFVGMSAAGKMMSVEERQRAAREIAEESAPVLARHAEGADVGFDLATNLATAAAG